MFAEALLTKAETNTWPKRPRTDESLKETCVHTGMWGSAHPSAVNSMGEESKEEQTSCVYLSILTVSTKLQMTLLQQRTGTRKRKEKNQRLVYSLQPPSLRLLSHPWSLSGLCLVSELGWGQES